MKHVYSPLVILRKGDVMEGVYECLNKSPTDVFHVLSADLPF